MKIDSDTESDNIYKLLDEAGSNEEVDIEHLLNNWDTDFYFKKYRKWYSTGWPIKQCADTRRWNLSY